jgi:alkaline phosphatase
LGLTVALVAILAPTVGADGGKRKYKNVIFMVPDGCAPSIQTLARWYQLDEPLTLDSMNAGMVKIHMSNSVITGSAAAATAFSAGHKTTVRFLGVGPRGNDLLDFGIEPFDPDLAYAPMATILEAAKHKGKSTGLVATSRITHATPAAFASHIPDRGWDNEIMEHMVYNNLTVALGGARRHLLPTSMGGRRTDGENLEQVLIDRGYDVVLTKGEMDAVVADRDTKLWGAFNMSHMDAEIDRPQFNPDEPSIAEMTAKAIEVLSQNPHGFFLMVEGSQVDWAGHNNDPIWMVTDFLAFDKAVKVAVDFAKSNNDTLVMAFPDHNTGGMKIGHYDTAMSYTATTTQDLIGPLLGMTCTASAALAQSDGDPAAAISDYWGIDPSPECLAEIDALAPSVGTSYAMARSVSKHHTVIGWTTHGHNGEDVPVWIYPEADAIGVINNTDLAHWAMATFSGRGGVKTLGEVTEKLYINVEDEFPGEWELDVTDPENPVLVVQGTYEMPISKDYVEVGGMQYDLGSLVVYAPLRDGDASDDGSIHTVVEDRVYIPETAVDFINGHDDDDDDDDDRRRRGRGRR